MSSHLENAEDVDFIIKTAIERDPKKRRVKPVETQSNILDFDLGESSDDSDFRIEDHAEISDDYSMDSKSGSDKDSSSDDEDEGEDSCESDIDDLKDFKLNSSRNGLSVTEILENAKREQQKYDEKAAEVMICCGCLGDHSDGVNEIAECDGCGVTVHEACYGISDTTSLASTDSLSPTTPWFCEACRAGVTNPVCELCPNSGGIFKETDVGKWVHLVCALYVPGVAFGEVDKLSSVTLFEMQYNKWGAKSCSLCLDQRFARTGVCIGCDAGMCRTYFHVTCAQREGFLSEAHSEEVDQADPFYAHCKIHSDKTLVKRRKRNYMALQLRMHHRKLKFQEEGHSESAEQVRIQRKLEKKRMHYSNYKSLKSAPWVPTQKMPRLLTTSASACRKLLKKAEYMGIDTVALEMQEAHSAALVDIRKKWHIPPAFTVEFIAYYLDRNERLQTMKSALETFYETNQTLLEEQHKLRIKYDELLIESTEEQKINANLKQQISKLHSAILSACSDKQLPNIDDIGKPLPERPQQPQPMLVPTAAALKMGVGFPLNNIPSNRSDTSRVLSSQARQEPLQLNECGICHKCNDQHMLAKCDTCHLFYHLNCLNPPLTRLPKKSKLYGWQCSECDKTSDSDGDAVKTPRRSRVRSSKGQIFDEEHTPKLKIKPVEPSPEISPPIKVKSPIPNSEPINHTDVPNSSLENSNPIDTSSENPYFVNNSLLDSSSASVTQSHIVQDTPIATTEDGVMIISRSGKKRRREKHRNRYSPDVEGAPVKEHKRKRKKKCLDIDEPVHHPRITIKIKPIPMPAGEVASIENPQCFYVNNESNDAIPSHSNPIPQRPYEVKPPVLTLVSDIPTYNDDTRRASAPPIIENNICTEIKCDVCQRIGSTGDCVKCDECLKNYHFSCLEPPLKKSPKKRGYSWHCADCDPTASE